MIFPQLFRKDKIRFYTFLSLLSLVILLKITLSKFGTLNLRSDFPEKERNEGAGDD
jgi:hypothetical protein